MIPKTEKFTDLESALHLAKVTLEQRNYTDRRKTLIIISDGINDLPPKNGEDKMTKTILPDVNIILVRPKRKDYIEGKSRLVTNSIHDAFLNLKNF